MMGKAGTVRERRVRAVLAALALCAAAAAFLAWRAAGRGPTTLVLVHPFGDPAWVGALEDEVGEFASLFPRYRVRLVGGDAAAARALVEGPAEGWDLAIGGSASLRAAGRASGPPLPLTGSFWSLWYGKEALAKSGIAASAGSGGLGAALAGEGYGVEDLREACRALRRAGIQPIALGSRFGWPLAAWIQAFVAAGTFPEEAEAMTLPGFDPASPGLTAALSLFRDFLDEGLVDPRHGEKDWPDSIRAVVEGKAAFCLVNDGFIASLPPAERAKLGRLPLPGSGPAEGGAWAIGSLAYLAGNADSPRGRGVEALFGYLSSQGVTARLEARTGAPFFAKGRGPDRLIPSVASDSVNPVIDAIRLALRP